MTKLMLGIIIGCAIVAWMLFVTQFTGGKHYQYLHEDHEKLEALIYIAASNIYVKTSENGRKLDLLLNIATNSIPLDSRR